MCAKATCLKRSNGQRNLLEGLDELSSLSVEDWNTKRLSVEEWKTKCSDENPKKGCCSRADFGLPEANGYAIVSLRFQ